MNYIKEYNRWLKMGVMKEDLEKITNDQIKECFHKNLTFGTGGIRAIMGPGPNRLNVYTIRKNTEGYARFIESKGTQAKAKGIVIAYDNRNHSYEFALEAAKILATHEIRVFLFESLRPTPELSFAIRFLHAQGGIVITASHNPPEYNGYKTYDHHGCQSVLRDTDIIINYIKEVEDIFDIEINDKKKHYISFIGDEIDEAYYSALQTVQERPQLDKNIKIVYTPLHGTGNIPVRTMLKRIGYDVEIVKEQCTPDPFFSKTDSPNPENKKAFNSAIQLAEKCNADLVIATDPDCDRLGIVVKHNNQYQYMTGNQTGAVLLEYLLSSKKEKGTLPCNGIVFDTIVTASLGAKVAKKYGMEVESTLTGFKFIGDKIREYNGEKTFVFGYEESYGYLIKDFVRDKDGVQSSILIAEACQYYKNKNKTLIDILYDLYHEFGYLIDIQESKTLPGIDGAEEINNIVNQYRYGSFKYIEKRKIVAKEDYLLSIRYDQNGETPLTLPKSNVIKLFLEDGSWIVVRPSGNEPKIKYYKNLWEKKMKKALITGITGQDGSYLAEFLLEKGYEVHGIIRRASVPTTERINHILDRLIIHEGDLTDSSSINRIVLQVQPDEIYNLAAQSHVGVSFDAAEYTGDVVALGVLRILEAVHIAGLEKKCKIYQASTSELYGKVEECPQNENTPFHPYSPYAVAKQYGFWMVKEYREAYGMFACNGILFNHESERRGENFVTRKITLAAGRIACGLQDHLELGNLDSLRDWGYAKDYVECMWLILQHDEPDDFVIATGEQHTVREFTTLAFAHVGIDIEWKGKGLEEKGYDKATGKMVVCVNPKWFRPTDVVNLWGDPTKAKTVLGWNPQKTSYEELCSIMAEHDFQLAKKEVNQK